MVVRRILFVVLAALTLITVAGMAWPVPRPASRETAPAGAFAFVARLNALVGDERETCTATLVGRWWAVTAAHCVNRVDRLAMTLTFDATGHGGSGVTRGVEATFVDPSRQDVALLELDAPVHTIEPVRLARPEDAWFWRTGAPVTAVGWGGRAAELHWTSQVVHDRSASLDHGKLSTAPATGRFGGWAIPGDSGGPLLAQDPTSRRYVQVGTFSMLSGGRCVGRICLPVTGNRWGKVGKPVVHRWLSSTMARGNASRPAGRPVHSHPGGRRPHPLYRLTHNGRNRPIGGGHRG